MAAPAMPTNVYVQQGNGQVLISWSLSAGATSYSVLRSTDGITYASLGSTASTQYLDTTVTVGTQYWYEVQAVNGSGSSPATIGQSVVPVNSGIMTLGQLRLQAQQRADRVNSNFVTLPEWNTYINQAYFELYDLLTTVYEDYNLASPILILTDGLSSQYTLPNGSNFLNGQSWSNTGTAAQPFYKLMGVDLGLSANTNAFVTLHKFDFIERNRYVYPNITSTFLGVFNARYRLVGNTLYFIPVLGAGQYLRVWYVPRCTQLLSDTDMCDGVDGWTEYIIVDAAIRALQKEESDVSVLLAQKMALKARIEETAMNRDAGEPDTISQVRGNSGSGWGGGPGWDGGFGGY